MVSSPDWITYQAASFPMAQMGLGPGGMGMGQWESDQCFIEMMIPHRRMGMMMASHTAWNTQHRELRNLQAAMVKVQSQEIAQMEQWYSQWYGPLHR
jgi:uncharacterized protein (DUF305 family)